MQKILARHVTNSTALTMLGTVVVLALLFILFAYIGELSSLKPGYGAWEAFQYVMWEAPRNFNRILPISALIGAVLGLGSLASNSELIVMRAAGVSLWRIVGWVMRPALLLVVLSLAISQWVIPVTNEKANRVNSQTSVAALGEVKGYWSREGQRFIYIDYANSAGQLDRVQILDFNDDYRLQSVLKAQQGHFIQNGEWRLNDTTNLAIAAAGTAQFKQTPEQALSLALQPRFVHMVTVDPEDLAPSELITFMNYLNKNSQVPKTYTLAFWKKVGAPFSLLALTLIACSFIFGPLRQQSMGFRLVIALFIGLGIYYLQDFLGYASLVYAPSPAWFVFTPIVLMYAFGSYLIYRAK